MSSQGVVAVALAGVAVLVTAVAMVITVRRLVTQHERPAVLAAMTLAQRRRAMRQIRRAQVVAPSELAGVRALAVEAAGMRHLALVFAGTTALFVGQALFPLFPAVLRGIDVVAAIAQAFAAVAFLYTSSRARCFVATHPDPSDVVGVGR